MLWGCKDGCPEEVTIKGRKDSTRGCEMAKLVTCYICYDALGPLKLFHFPLSTTPHDNPVRPERWNNYSHFTREKTGAQMG